jgi:cardiolipin synthase
MAALPQEIWHLLAQVIGFSVAVLHLAFIPLVLARRREPAVTLAWLLCLLLLPAVGVVLFWVFGRGQVRRSARARQRLLVERRQNEPAPDLGAMDATSRALARTAWEVGRAPLRHGNRVDVLLNAEATYPAELQAIAQARESLDAAFYVFRADETGRAFRDALVAAARRGVRVRLLLDAFGCAGSGRFFRPLRHGSGKVARFLPVTPWQGWSLNLRNHRKILIADGTIGFTGGLNVGDEYLGTRRLGAWRDTHLRIQGPAVHDLAAVFEDDWAFAVGEPRSALGPVPEPFADGSPVQILPSGPDDRAEAIFRVNLAAIAAAQHSIELTTPYFVPDRPIAEALITAALRGIKVRLLLPGKNNQRLTALASRSYWDELLDVGVEILSYAPGMVHAKTLLVDRRWAAVGSANMDVRSFRLNFEINALLYGPLEARVLGGAFDADVALAERVERQTFARRSFWWRAAEGGARLLSPIL